MFTHDRVGKVCQWINGYILCRLGRIVDSYYECWASEKLKPEIGRE